MSHRRSVAFLTTLLLFSLPWAENYISGQSHRNAQRILRRLEPHYLAFPCSADCKHEQSPMIAEAYYVHMGSNDGLLDRRQNWCQLEREKLHSCPYGYARALVRTASPTPSCRAPAHLRLFAAEPISLNVSLSVSCSCTARRSVFLTLWSRASSQTVTSSCPVTSASSLQSRPRKVTTLTYRRTRWD